MVQSLCCIFTIWDVNMLHFWRSNAMGDTAKMRARGMRKARKGNEKIGQFFAL